MKGEWAYYKGYFSPEVCAKILEEGLKLPVKDATLGVDGNTDLANYRKSKVRFIQKDDPNFRWLFDELWKLAIETNDIWFGFHISRITYIQLAEYDESYSGHYDKHHDVFWMSGTNYQRKLTAVVQLTDPSTYEGGNLEMIGINEYPNLEEVRTQGTVFFFPSFEEHQATAVTKGTRYSLACWFDGPHWV